MAQLAKWQILDGATAARKRLLRAGFLPIPCIGKTINIADWPSIVATETDIDGWFNRYPDAANTGVLTRTTPAIDLDVYDPSVAEELEATLFEMIGEEGRTMVRFGRPPKRASFALELNVWSPYRQTVGPRQVRRAFIISNGEPVTIRDILSRAYPRLRRFNHWHRFSCQRALLSEATVIGRNRFGSGRANLWKPKPKPSDL